MLDQNDERWSDLTGGYRTQFDPRPLLSKLESGQDLDRVWNELWEELHHQGDVGEASYAAVPEIVRIHRQRGRPDWNTFGIVACIELARTQKRNPPLPDWLEKDYFDSIQELAKIGLCEYGGANDPNQTHAILSILAISKGARIFGELLLKFEEKELLEYELPLSAEQ
jgi:hypothetical protein